MLSVLRRFFRLTLLLFLLSGCSQSRLEPIKVGVLHSITGDMAASEKPSVDATMLALEELNQEGGLLGRPIKAIIGDGKSDPATFAKVAETLIREEGVDVLFGCWTSADRKTVIPILARNHHLLIYPMQYEGLEMSPYIIYTGAAPNQQLIPGIKWAFDNLGKRFFLVGSDYVYPRASNAIARGQLKGLGAEVVGEEYVLLGSDKVDSVIEKIRQAQPDVILNTLMGEANSLFFKKLRASGVTAESIPTMSFSLAESDLLRMDPEPMIGDYATWNYFQSVDTPANRKFVSNFKERYGAQRVTDDPAESAYLGVKLWAQAVTEVASTSTHDVRRALKDQSFEAPGGIVYVDAATNHTWKPVRVGQIQADGQFSVVWKSERPVRPSPYPVYRTPDEWNAFIEEMYQSWGGQWHNPGSK